MKIQARSNSPSSSSKLVSPPTVSSVEGAAVALQNAGTPYFRLLELPSHLIRGARNKQPGIFQYLTQNEVNNLRSLSKDRRLDEQALLVFNNDGFNMKYFKTKELQKPNKIFFSRYNRDSL